MAGAQTRDLSLAEGQMDVLLVDDDEDFLGLTATFLEEKYDISITKTTAPEQVLSLISEHDIECIVSDYSMPHLTGLELLHLVQDSFPDLPFIIFTGQGSEDVAMRALSEGATDYVQKQGTNEQYATLANRIRNAVLGFRTDQALLTRDARVKALETVYPDLVFFMDSEGQYLEYLVGAESREYLYRHPEEFLGKTVDQVLPPKVATQIRHAITDVLETGQVHTTEYKLEIGDQSHWFEARIAPFHRVTADDAVVFVARNVTERHEYEEQLHTLYQATSELMQATTADEIYDTAVRCANRILSLSSAAALKFDETTGNLVFVSGTSDIRHQVDTSVRLSETEYLEGDVFSRGTAVYLDDIGEEDELYTALPSNGSAFLVPLGNHGVFVNGCSNADAYSTTDRKLVRTLSSNVKSALDRLERENQLKRQETTLRQRNAELERASVVNTILRKVTQIVSQASIRTEIEEGVVDQLADFDLYQCAWLGTLEDGSITPQSWAGLDANYFDKEDDPLASETPLSETIQTAIETASVQFVPNILEDPFWEPSRRESLSMGYTSLAVVPLVHGSNVLGVLVICAGQPNAFDGQQSVFKELGETIGSGIHNIERTLALVNEHTVEVELELRDLRLPIAQISEEAECTFTLEQAIPKASGQYTLIMHTDDGDYARIQECAAELTSLRSLELLTEDKDGTLIEFGICYPPIIELIYDQGVHLSALSASQGRVELTAELPKTIDVSSFLNQFRDLGATVELRSRRELSRTSSSDAQPSELELTERQHEVVKLAFERGFFDWPRGVDGQDLADELGISPSTVYQHLRTSERKLFSKFFET